MKLFEVEDITVTPKVYKINGKEYIRVTDTLGVIAKNKLTAWMGKVGTAKAHKILSSRQAIGSTTHALIEKVLNGESFEVYEYENEIQVNLKTFMRFKKVAKLEPVATEQPLWSNIFGYAGTCDFIGYYKSPKELFSRKKDFKFEDKSLVIIDWKTSRGIYKQYGLQLSAYAFALQELTGMSVDGGVIVQFRDGRVNIKEYTKEELDNLFQIYRAVLVIYRWKNE